MTKKFFITGTDTDAGKTYVATGILRAFKALKYSTLGIKPVASGASFSNGHLVNQDALSLQEVSSISLHYHQINPITLQPAIAPHIAATAMGKRLSVHEIKQKTQYALQFPADICVVEGAGGWLVPLNEEETMADFVKAINISVILVVGIRLGCINHALLTEKAITAMNVPLIGWVANVVEPNVLVLKEIVETLKNRLVAPLLGQINFKESVEGNIDLSVLLNA